MTTIPAVPVPVAATSSRAVFGFDLGRIRGVAEEALRKWPAPEPFASGRPRGAVEEWLRGILGSYGAEILDLDWGAPEDSPGAQVLSIRRLGGEAGTPPRLEDFRVLVRLPSRHFACVNYLLARRIAHVLLHWRPRDQGLGEEIVFPMRTRPSAEELQMEREAQLFALDLLLPVEEFTEHDRQVHGDPYAHAYRFGVSPHVVSLRSEVLRDLSRRAT